MPVRKMLSFLFCCVLTLLTSCGGGSNLQPYSVGVDQSWFPLDLEGKENNVTAFSTELLQEIGKVKKIAFSKNVVSWDRLLEGLQGKEYQAILGSIPPYNFNQSQYDFSELYLKTGPVLILPANSKMQSPEMLKGKEIAVLAGSSGTLVLERYPGILIRPYDTVPRMLSDVVKGVIDGALVDVLIGGAYVNDLYYGQLKIATYPLNNEGLRLMTLHKPSIDLVEAFNDGLEKVKASGEYDKLLKKWSLTQ